MQVRILQPAKAAEQSGRAKTLSWFIEPVLPSPRLPEPLMGWASANDTLNELRRKLRFPTCEAAVAFAQKRGWAYTVDAPNLPVPEPKSYLDNFKILRPEDEERLSRRKN